MPKIYPDNRLSDSEQLIPRAALRMMAGLVVATLTLTGFAVLSDRPHEAQVHVAPVAHDMEILIEGGERGSAIVRRLDGTLLAQSDRNASGFIAVVWNALEFQRAKHAVDENHPVTLIRFADGRIGLRDDATGWKINLTGFGRDNTAAWAAILAQGT